MTMILIVHRVVYEVLVTMLYQLRKFLKQAVFMKLVPETA